MTQENKELLLKDLCARLPFHVKVAIDFEGYLEVLPDDENLQYPYRKNLNFILDYDNKTIEDISKEPHILYAYPCTERFAMLRGYTYELDYGVPVEFIKPYLRPLSSMTEEEKNELFQLMGRGTDIERIDFYISHHFDYRGLIEKGLALKAPEDMYK
jgi:hypothetical protein